MTIGIGHEVRLDLGGRATELDRARGFPRDGYLGGARALRRVGALGQRLLGALDAASLAVGAGAVGHPSGAGALLGLLDASKRS